MSDQDERIELATVELLGALAYGQLRAFESAARAIRFAVGTEHADEVAGFARHEHDGYLGLRDLLAARTDLAFTVMDRQRPHFDRYFDQAPLDDWFGACTFFALGLPIAADFGREIAGALDDATAEVVLASIADRDQFERSATRALSELLVDDEARERARGIVADLLGRALSAYQGVMSDTDALRVLLEADRAEGETSERRVKRLAIEVISGHRRRMVALGLEDLDDVG